MRTYTNQVQNQDTNPSIGAHQQHYIVAWEVFRFGKYLEDNCLNLFLQVEDVHLPPDIFV